MDDRELQERLLPKLVHVHGEPIDPNVLAAYVDGALSQEEHAEVEALIAADPDALLLVRALQEDRSRRNSARTWSIAALAAAVLLAVGLWWTGGADEAELDLEGRLAAVTADLVRAEPDLFGDFAPLRDEELASEPAVMRGGPQWLAPIGVLDAAPAQLRWRNPPGATRAEVVITGDGFRWKKQVEGERITAPPLEPGRYVVTLRGLETLASQRVRSVFEIADANRRDRFTRALADIRRSAPEDLAELLVAHYAVRQRLFDVARPAALAAQALEGDVGIAAKALLKHIDAVASAR